MTHQLATHSQWLADEQATLDAGANMSRALIPGIVIYLCGELGAGKTTFTRGILRGLGYDNKVKSPTYTLVEEYEVGSLRILHFDLYRLHSADELRAMGMADYFTEENICLVEWPEHGESCLPSADITCYIATRDAGREIKFVAHSARGLEIIKKLK